MPRSRACLPVALVLLGLACGATTKLSTVWKEPSYTGPGLKRILVLGVAEDPTTRRAFEDRFAQALDQRGATALASYHKLPADGRLSKEALAQVVRDHAIDGVIVTRLLKVDKEEEYIPPQSYVVGRSYGYYGYYGMGYDVVNEPGYTRTNTIVRLETQLFDVRTQKLIWGAHSDTFNPSSTGDTIQSVSKQISKRLAKDGLLPSS